MFSFAVSIFASWKNIGDIITLMALYIDRDRGTNKIPHVTTNTVDPMVSGAFIMTLLSIEQGVYVY